VLKLDWFLEDDTVNTNTLLAVEIDCIVYTFYVEGADVVSNIKRWLEGVVLTLLVCVDYVDYIEDEETTISSLFSSSLLTSTLVSEINYIYIKSDVSSISIILSVVLYRIYVISRSAKS
jgi:hypothetical protein